MRQFEVEGETFEVSLQPGSWYAYEVKWVSGPNDGYGFVYSSYGSEPQTDDDIENAIRNFLGQVDPATGYIG